jgi:pimeloyl-ACP methyl ester carboxylesterase
MARDGVSDSPDDSVVLIDGPWTHRMVRANGIALHVAEVGTGPLVLMLHGFPQFWWTWRQQLVDLANAGFRAVAVDLRGYGASDKPPRGYDAPNLTADIAQLVRALGERDAVIVGNDVGGLLAWTVAALHPRVVRRLVVLGAAHPLRVRSAVLTDPRGQAHASAYALRSFQVPRRPEARLTRDSAYVRAGVFPLAGALLAPRRRPAVCPCPAAAGHRTGAAPARRLRRMCPATHCPGLGALRHRRVLVAGARRGGPLPAERGTRADQRRADPLGEAHLGAMPAG